MYFCCINTKRVSQQKSYPHDSNSIVCYENRTTNENMILSRKNTNELKKRIKCFKIYILNHKFFISCI